MQVKVKICEFFSMISFCCKKIMCFWVVRYVVGSIWICVFLGLYVCTYTCFCECARIRFSARVCVCAPTWCLWEGRWAWSRSDQRSSSHTSASGRLRWWRRCFPMYRRRCGEKLLWDVKHSCFTLLASLTHTHTTRVLLKTVLNSNQFSYKMVVIFGRGCSRVDVCSVNCDAE